MNRMMIGALACASMLTAAYAGETLLLEGWKFKLGACVGAEAKAFDDSSWQSVRIPHDWAIAGPFDKEIDKQVVRVVQDGEKVATEKTGRTGSLPWLGEGWYRLPFTVPQNTGHAEFVFDGAMAEPCVYIDGVKVGEWKIGYNSFVIDVTKFVKPGAAHQLAVHLQNVPESSRWYPGAGLYRPVRLVTGPKIGLKTWGTYARTTQLREDGAARVSVTSEIRGMLDKGGLRVTLLDACGIVQATAFASACKTVEATAVLEVPAPRLWSPEDPYLYTLATELIENGEVADRNEMKFGIRTAEFAKDGFRLNGKLRKFKGVCLHHDLGPLGAAFNKAAFRRQVRLLKDMGCDSIRTAHNMPAPWQMDICDETGMMVMAESFDMWEYPKCKNGYSRFFQEWWRKDLENLVLCNRNHASIVMWSIGNEIPEQSEPNKGRCLSRAMQDVCHRLDPSRSVTQGLDRVDDAVKFGMLQVMDVVGLNYRLHRYHHAYTNSPTGLILGSETASTVSSRGVYKFPAVPKTAAKYPDGQCSSYDLEQCSWSNLPDDDWAMQDDNVWTTGEFVWTGFDYLGEPTPYNEYWPSRSSYFGIFDLAGLPKDRMWLYRSRWNETSSTLHLLPHWTWPGREGRVTPVYCYTSYPSAELFVNGVSQGRRTFDKSSRLDRYRLRWNDVVYAPGELKVVAYDIDGRRAEEKIIRTAGEPKRIVVSLDRNKLNCATSDDTPDLAFATVKVVDKDGNECPTADASLKFEVSGSVRFNSACNGDSTSLESFVKPTMRLFNGQLVVVLEAGKLPGKGSLTVTGAGLESGHAPIDVNP